MQSVLRFSILNLWFRLKWDMYGVRTGDSGIPILLTCGELCQCDGNFVGAHLVFDEPGKFARNLANFPGKINLSVLGDSWHMNWLWVGEYAKSKGNSRVESLLFMLFILSLMSHLLLCQLQSNQVRSYISPGGKKIAPGYEECCASCAQDHKLREKNYVSSFGHGNDQE